MFSLQNWRTADCNLPRARALELLVLFAHCNLPRARTRVVGFISFLIKSPSEIQNPFVSSLWSFTAGPSLFSSLQEANQNNLCKMAEYALSILRDLLASFLLARIISSLYFAFQVIDELLEILDKHELSVLLASAGWKRKQLSLFHMYTCLIDWYLFNCIEDFDIEYYRLTSGVQYACGIKRRSNTFRLESLISMSSRSKKRKRHLVSNILSEAGKDIKGNLEIELVEVCRKKFFSARPLMRTGVCGRLSYLENLSFDLSNLENLLIDKAKYRMEYKIFQGLEQALKNTAWGKTPDYLESIANRIEKARGKATEVFHIPVQVLVCAAIKEMEDLAVENLDWDTLEKWGATLKYAKDFGFQVAFADNLLKTNLLAYLAYSTMVG
ncbi:hypothetical protein V6N13_013963 [Hibiscus sabdariffa]|uniref:Uncharacterized protein n=1 Tax=Hibiscus sabdariffa TaxID=183260 RepID=A0ABR2RTQ4_9ROSI